MGSADGKLIKRNVRSYGREVIAKEEVYFRNRKKSLHGKGI